MPLRRDNPGLRVSPVTQESTSARYAAPIREAWARSALCDLREPRDHMHRRVAFEPRVQHLLLHLPHGAEAGALVFADRARVVERAGIDDEFLRVVGPRLIHRPVQEVLAEAAADEIAEQAEIVEGDRRLRPPVELDETRRLSAGIEHV